jgi:pilus assembly protein CpaF
VFAIIISEKGGAERRETFDKNEINVGRVQGNDLMLPKGNVSKHHARLLYRDGRFIVTDLKSTNGTYVNGRKIAQATIVREGDKIYIGDFVLRLDTANAAAGAEDAMTAGASDGPDRLLARTGPNPNAAPAAATSANRAMPMPGASNDPGAPTNFPLEQGAPVHEDGSEPAALGGGHLSPGMPKMPPAARIPTAISAGMSPNQNQNTMPVGMPPIPGGGAGASMSGASSPAAGASARAGASGSLPATQSSAPTRAAASSPQVGGPVSARERERPSSSGGAASPSRVPPRESSQQAARRLALMTLVDRVADATDLSALRTQVLVDDQTSARIDRTVREQASSMQSEGEAPEGTNLDQLVGDAVRELVGLGPIGALLEDDDVTEIHCLRHDHVLATRGGVVGPADASFTSDEALMRVIWRLVQQTGQPVMQGEHVVERRISRGAHLMALLPPASSTHALIIRKRRRLDMSLEDFVRLGGLSRAMATFLENCMSARANILVCGSNNQTVASFLAALAMASPPGDRVAVLQEVDEFTVPHAHVLSVALPDTRARGEEAVRAASKARPDRLVVSSLAGNVAAATLEAISEGAEGVLAASAAPSLRQGLARLVAQVLLARPGMSVEAARECVGEAFDIAIEVAPMADGRNRVVRLAELGGTDAKGVVTRDLFTSATEGADGTFAATGVVPRVVGEFSQRGVKVDPNLFKRSVGRPS